MRSYIGGLAVVALACGLSTGQIRAQSAGCLMPEAGPGGLSIMFDQINAVRIGSGLSSLKISAPLSIAAQLYACKLASPETSGIAAPSRAAAYVEMRRAGCNGTAMEDAVLVGPPDGLKAFELLDTAPDLRRTYVSTRMREIGLGVAL
ncbi:MAG: hypothetical protein RLZZ528_2089, partial [Pseudomonadota bacterium]